MSTKDDNNTPDNLVYLPAMTSLPIPVSRVVEGIPEDLKEVVVLGVEEDGNLYLASSENNLRHVLHLIQVSERYTWRIMENQEDA